MPELPEVETIRCQLAATLTDARFLRLEEVEQTMLRDCSEQELRDLLPGRCIRTVEREGKFLVLALSEDYFLTLHLGMTGQLLLTPPAPHESSPHSRFSFILRVVDGSQMRLRFRDIRKFGRLHLTLGRPAPRLEALGPDAWKGEWDAACLAERLQGRSGLLKAFLLDQHHLAGIGNIYADEILWWARLSPLRVAGSLSEKEVGRLAEEIRERLGEGIRLLGCSFSDYVDTQGRRGGFQDWLRAYGKYGQECTRCGRTLRRVLVAGRGTTYCPGCQE